MKLHTELGRLWLIPAESPGRSTSRYCQIYIELTGVYNPQRIVVFYISICDFNRNACLAKERKTRKINFLDIKSAKKKET